MNEIEDIAEAAELIVPNATIKPRLFPDTSFVIISVKHGLVRYFDIDDYITARRKLSHRKRIPQQMELRTMAECIMRGEYTVYGKRYVIQGKVLNGNSVEFRVLNGKPIIHGKII